MIIEKEEIDNYLSPWGNRFREISVEDLISILRGKILYLNGGEYSTFVYLETGDEGKE